jgi:very-short-patch-repair endonuclease
MLRDRRLDAKWRRQRVIGDYIVDFVCLDHRLIIEADGGHHAENETDVRRDAFLKAQGFRILRLWNNEILSNPGGVYEAIASALHTPHPSAASPLPPSPVAGEGKRKEHG